MRTNLLKHVRQHRSEYHWGERFAGRIHIRSSPRTLIRELRGKIVNREHRIGPKFKGTRIALYAGGMIAHRRERQLCDYFRM